MMNYRHKILPFLVAGAMLQFASNAMADQVCELDEVSNHSAITALCPFKNGFARIQVGIAWGFVDADGKLVIRPQFTQVTNFNEELAGAQLDDKWGVIDRRGHWVVPPTLEELGTFSGGLAPAVVDGKCGYIDTTGKWVIAPSYAFARGFSGPVAAVSESRSSALLIDRQGRIIKRFPEKMTIAENEAVGGNYVALLEADDLLLNVDGRKTLLPLAADLATYKDQHFVASKYEKRGDQEIICMA